MPSPVCILPKTNHRCRPFRRGELLGTTRKQTREARLPCLAHRPIDARRFRVSVTGSLFGTHSPACGF